MLLCLLFLNDFLEEKLVAQMAKQMLEGVRHLHKNKLAHIDIKPMVSNSELL